MLYLVQFIGEWFVIHDLTCLKVSRVHAILPKHLISMGCCTPIKTVGRIFCTLTGNECQSNWSMESLIPDVASLIRSPNSHGINAKTIDCANSETLVSTNTKRPLSYKVKLRITLKKWSVVMIKMICFPMCINYNSHLK